MAINLWNCIILLGWFGWAKAEITSAGGIREGSGVAAKAEGCNRTSSNWC
jgi:hypothetical protein